MKKIIAWGALLLSAAIASCSGSGAKSKDANAGVGGEAAGQPSAGGGDETDSAGVPSAFAAGATGKGEAGQGGAAAGQGGAAAGQGGEPPGSAGKFSIEGTVYAPKDGDVEATVVIGCAWIADGCDDQKSQALQLSESGPSGSYSLRNLESGLTYLVLFWKDLNASGEVDDGDYVGVVTDESGVARGFTEAAAGADGIMAVQQTIVATGVPEELVGDWFTVSQSVGVTNEWIFGADGSASNAFTINSAVCGGGAGTAINSQGVISVEGDQLTFSPASGQKTVKPCAGAATTTSYYTSARHFTWRVGPSSQQAGTALYLTDLQDTAHTEAEFQKL